MINHNFEILTATRGEYLPVVVSVCVILATLVAFAACAVTGVGLIEW